MRQISPTFRRAFPSPQIGYAQPIDFKANRIMYRAVAAAHKNGVDDLPSIDTTLQREGGPRGGSG